MKSHRSFHAKLVCGSEAEADIGAMFNDRSNGRIPDQQPLAHKWYIGLSNLVNHKHGRDVKCYRIFITFEILRS